MTTQTKRKPITKSQVRTEIKRIIAENPDAVNPSAGRMCLYHKGRGRNIRRCIIGKLGFDLGLPTPTPYGDGPVDCVAGPGGLWANRFTSSALDYMSVLQAVADGDSKSGLGPRPWGEIPKEVL
jgi:hypothetical protein